MTNLLNRHDFELIQQQSKAMSSALEALHGIDRELLRYAQEFRSRYAHLLDVATNSPLLRTINASLQRHQDIQISSLPIPEIAEIQARIDKLGIRQIYIDSAMIDVVRSIQNAIKVDRFTLSFLSNLVSQLEAIQDATEQQDTEAITTHIQELWALMIVRIRLLAPNASSCEGIFNLLIAIIIFIYQTVDTAQMEKRLKESTAAELVKVVKREVKEGNAELLKAIEALQPTQAERQRTSYFIKRESALKIRPSSKAATIANMYPNQKVILVKTKGRWIYIEYFDYVEGLPKAGWVLKKYANRIEGLEAGEYRRQN